MYETQQQGISAKELIMIHSYNDEGICFSQETELGRVMERKLQV